MATLTKGNVIVEEIKIGDIHFEFEYGTCRKTKVISKPVRDKNSCWSWNSINLTTGKVIKYAVQERMAHYSVNLYNYEAYSGTKYI